MGDTGRNCLKKTPGTQGIPDPEPPVEESRNVATMSVGINWRDKTLAEGEMQQSRQLLKKRAGGILGHLSCSSYPTHPQSNKGLQHLQQGHCIRLIFNFQASPLSPNKTPFLVLLWFVNAFNFGKALPYILSSPFSSFSANSNMAAELSTHIYSRRLWPQVLWAALKSQKINHQFSWQSYSYKRPLCP